MSAKDLIAEVRALAANAQRCGQIGDPGYELAKVRLAARATKLADELEAALVREASAQATNERKPQSCKNTQAELEAACDLADFRRPI